MPTSTPSRPEREPQEGLDAARDSSWGDEADDAHLDVGGPDVAGSATVSARAAGDDAARQPVPGEPSADPQVLTIRARRATPPTGETEPEAELVLPPNRPPLRPAQPAAQPRRRRFGRANR